MKKMFSDIVFWTVAAVVAAVFCVAVLVIAAVGIPLLAVAGVVALIVYELSSKDSHNEGKQV